MPLFCTEFRSTVVENDDSLIKNKADKIKP